MNTFAPELSALMIILAIGRAGDLDAAVLQILRDRGDLPVALADRLRSRQAGSNTCN